MLLFDFCQPLSTKRSLRYLWTGVTISSSLSAEKREPYAAGIPSQPSACSYVGSWSQTSPGSSWPLAPQKELSWCPWLWSSRSWAANTQPKRTSCVDQFIQNAVCDYIKVYLFGTEENPPNVKASGNHLLQLILTCTSLLYHSRFSHKFVATKLRRLHITCDNKVSHIRKYFFHLYNIKLVKYTVPIANTSHHKNGLWSSLI